MKTDIDDQIDAIEYQIQNLRKRVAELRLQRPKQESRDYTFKDWEGGEVRLSNLFGYQNRLILVHNMGRACAYCTMWADGFTGLLPHLMSRAAFVVTSPDPPEAQKEFAQSRGWNFLMYSAHGTDFMAEMGFVENGDGFLPGVSVFERAGDGKIYRVSRAEFCPGDNFCAVWHFFDLMPEGVNNWEPKFSYDSGAIEMTAKSGVVPTQIERVIKG